MLIVLGKVTIQLVANGTFDEIENYSFSTIKEAINFLITEYLKGHTLEELGKILEKFQITDEEV